MSKQPEWAAEPGPLDIDWEANIAEVLERGKSVPEVEWCLSGEDNAHKVPPTRTVSSINCHIRSIAISVSHFIPCPGSLVIMF